MKKILYVIRDELGIHARPAGLLVKLASPFQSKIVLNKGEKQIDLKRIMALMGAGVRQGEEITIEIDGADEEIAAAQIEAFLKENL